MGLVLRRLFTQPSRTITQSWPTGSAQAAAAYELRHDIVDECVDNDGSFGQECGPFRQYRRDVGPANDGCVTETTTYRLAIPWFGWLFSLPMRRAIRHRRAVGTGSPWWAPPDRLNEVSDLIERKVKELMATL